MANFLFLLFISSLSSSYQEPPVIQEEVTLISSWYDEDGQRVEGSCTQTLPPETTSLTLTVTWNQPTWDPEIYDSEIVSQSSDGSWYCLTNSYDLISWAQEKYMGFQFSFEGTVPLLGTCYWVFGSDNSCIDIDECSSAADNCHATLATCTNTPGSFTCSCTSGYQGNGKICTDIDECTLEVDNCHAILAICTNIPGSYTCSCNLGYEGDGITCTATITTTTKPTTTSSTTITPATTSTTTTAAPTTTTTTSWTTSTIATVQASTSTVEPLAATIPSCSSCMCTNLRHLTVSEELKNKTFEEAVADLVVPPKKTSSYSRKKISVKDDRISSQSLGFVGIFVLSSTFALILLPDLIVLFKYTAGVGLKKRNLWTFSSFNDHRK